MRKLLAAVGLLLAVLSGSVSADTYPNGIWHSAQTGADLPVVTLTVNGKPVTSDVPAVIFDGRTLLPARAIAQALGAQVSWDAAHYTASITVPTAPTSSGTSSWDQDARAVIEGVMEVEPTLQQAIASVKAGSLATLSAPQLLDASNLAKTTGDKLVQLAVLVAGDVPPAGNEGAVLQSVVISAAREEAVAFYTFASIASDYASGTAVPAGLTSFVSGIHEVAQNDVNYFEQHASEVGLMLTR